MGKEKRKTRILLLLNQMALSGAPKIALHAFEAMANHIEVHTLALDGGPLEERFQKLGAVRVLSNPLPRHSSRFLRRAATVPRGAVLRMQGVVASASVRRFRPDLIYANSAASLHLMKYLKLPSVPGLLHLHECGIALEAYARHFPHLLLQWPARYIAVSQTVQGDLEQLGVPRHKIALIHEFIRRQDFDSIPRAIAPQAIVPQAIAPQESEQAPPLVVGGAGNISWCKGPELWLLMAWELKKLLGQNVRFVWVGVSQSRENREFREMARKLGLEESIQFVPLTTQPLEQFALLDVFALTSWEDSCPLVVLENMMLGKTIVCFRDGGGGAEEIGETGIVVEEWSPRLMAEAIADLAAAPQRRQWLGRDARERVLTHFEAAVQISRIRSEIEACIAQPAI